jgi:hypothetical protein
MELNQFVHGKSFMDRHFTLSDTKEMGWCSIVARAHFTGLVMLSLDGNQGDIKSVEFLTKAHPKKRNMYVQENEALVKFVFFDGQTEQILKSPYTGEVMAFNHQLVQNPNLAVTDPHGKGHVLFIMPRKRKRSATIHQS